MPIEYISHTADIRMKVTASSLQELFLLSMKGMSNILVSDACDRQITSEMNKHVEIRSNDVTYLLIDFLSDVLSHSYVDQCIYCSINWQHLDETSLKAGIRGKSFERLDEEIKAVTYHEANVKQNKDGDWEVTIIFDI